MQCFDLYFQTFSGVTARSPPPPPSLTKAPALQTYGCAFSAHIVKRHRDPAISYMHIGPPIRTGLLIRHYRHCAYNLRRNFGLRNPKCGLRL